MSNIISKYYKFPQTTRYIGQPVSPDNSESESENELNLPILSHILGTEQIYTLENDSE